MSVKSLLRWSGVAAVVVASSAGCSVYDKSLAVSGGGNECTPGAVGCIPRNIPGSSKPTDMEVAAFALRGVFLNQGGNAWKTIGFNIDNAVTSGSTPVSSCTPPSAGSISVDGENGIDNVFGSILVPQLLGVLFPTLEQDMCCFMQHGRGVLLLRISDWNGLPNDSQVTASLLSAVDGTADPVASVKWDSAEHGLVHTSDNTRAGAVSWAPRSSSYYVSRGDFQLGNEGDYGAVKQRDTTAYVRDGHLVMGINSTQPVSLYFADVGGIRIPLIGGKLVARISDDQDYLDVGVLGGRMSGDGLLEANVSLVANEINNAGSVEDRMSTCDTFSSTVGTIVRNYADTTSSLVDDDPSSECDAMSVGISFTGVRVRDLQLAAESLCVPKGDCVTYGPGVSCPEIAETHDGTTGSEITPVCWLGTPEAPRSLPTGGCNTTDWHVVYPGQSTGDASP